jgi:Domain of unknown function (DUF5655)
MTPDEFFDGVPLGRVVVGRILAILAPVAYEVRVTRSQVAFRARRGFAWLWRPSQYLGTRGVDVVLAIALDRHDSSPRWKEVVHPTPRAWMHHLEVRDAGQIDDEVAAWLLEAAHTAGAGLRDRQAPS